MDDDEIMKEFYLFMSDFPPHHRPTLKDVFKGGWNGAREQDAHKELAVVKRLLKNMKTEPIHPGDTSVIRTIKVVLNTLERGLSEYSASRGTSAIGVPVLPPVNWEGYYTRKGGSRWFWCVVVAHDQGKAVVRTKTSNYHAHSPDEFEFSKEPEGVRV